MVIPSSEEGSDARADASRRGVGTGRRAGSVGALAALVATLGAASSASPLRAEEMPRTGDFASVEASVSPDGVSRTTYRTVPIPLARSDASGALVSRTGQAALAEGDCRWPDERALAAILPVATDRGSHASGVVFATDRVLTAAHALADGTGYFVRIGSGYRKADLLLLDKVDDIAVLRVDTRGIEPLPIVEQEPAELEMVWAVGYPREAGRTTSSGVFQRSREGALHSSAPIDPGQSGGGLLACERGAFRMLGMLRGFGAYRDGDAYVKLANHSVSVAGATIHRVLAGRR